MKRKLYTLWIMLLVVMLMATPVYAGNIKLSGLWGDGSIHFVGYATGVGGYDGITLKLTGIGIPVVTCTNQGGNDAPGQNPSYVTAEGYTYVDLGKTESTDIKGKTDMFEIIANEGEITLTGTQGGCPNDNWTATIDSIDWVGAVIDVYEGPDTNGTLLKTFNFTCDPSLKNGDSLSCTQVSATTY